MRGALRGARWWMLAGALGAALASGCEQPQGDEFRGEDDLEEPVGESGQVDTPPDGVPGIDQTAGD